MGCVLDTRHRHGRACVVDGTESAGGDCLKLLIAGVTCTDVSAMGKRLRSCGPSVLVFVAWAYQALFDQPDIILMECTPYLLKSKSLLAIFEKHYEINACTFGPTDLGIPSERQRAYFILRRKERFPRPMSVPFTPSGFGSMFFRRMDLTAEAYLLASHEDREEIIRERAKDRGLPPSPGRGSSWRLEHVLSPSSQAHFRDYVAAAEVVVGGPAVVDVGQSLQFIHTVRPMVFPVLLQRSILAVTDGRPVHALEHLIAMGIPAPRLGAGVDVLGIPGIEELPDQQIRSLMGNAMHVCAVGSVALFALGVCKFTQ